MKKLLILRSPSRVDDLSLFLAENDVECSFLPLLSIEPCAIDFNEQLEKIEGLIFTSVNAVEHALPFIGDTLKGRKVFAIGKATQKTLLDYGFSNVVYPEEAGSEGLLCLLESLHLQQKYLVVFTGKNGLGRLQAGLRKLEINFSEYHVYQRQPQSYDFDKVFSQKPDAILVPSVDALNALLRGCPELALLELKSSLVLCYSSRISQAAEELGFSQIKTINFSREELLSALK